MQRKVNMDPMFKYLAKRIIIELSPTQFSFSIKEKNINISFAPFMCLQKDDDIWMPISIGEEIPPNKVTILMSSELTLMIFRIACRLIL
jgi:hypothetical protein